MMSDVPTSKWEAKLHGAYFWIHNCGGHSKVVKNTGLHIWMLELLYDKYCAPFDISRENWWSICLCYCTSSACTFNCIVFYPIELLDIPRSALR